MDLKTIGLDLRPAVVEHRKFKRVPRLGVWGFGRHRRGRRVLGGCQWDGRFLGCCAGLSEAF